MFHALLSFAASLWMDVQAPGQRGASDAVPVCLWSRSVKASVLCGSLLGKHHCSFTVGIQFESFQTGNSNSASRVKTPSTVSIPFSAFLLLPSPIHTALGKE